MEPSAKPSPPLPFQTERRAAYAGPERRRSDTPDGISTQPPARILVVEDQDDVRQMLQTALEIEGHVVDGASNAAEGLKRLQEARYNLVLSDYAMPGGTGTGMLHEATRRGLMDRTVALIVTAHPDVRDLPGVEVISKPLDLDHFLEQVGKILAEANERAERRRARGRRDERLRVELVLYVSSASPASLQAQRNLERILERFDGSQIAFTICDLVRDPLAGEADRVAYTPTLVKRFPEPRMWVLGNLKDPEIVSDLLRISGVDGGE